MRAREEACAEYFEASCGEEVYTVLYLLIQIGAGTLTCKRGSNLWTLDLQNNYQLGQSISATGRY